MPTLLISWSFQSFDDRDLVLGLAEPAAVVVECERAADLGGLFGERAKLCCGGGDAPFLLGAGIHGLAPKSRSTQRSAFRPWRLSRSRMIRDVAIELAGSVQNASSVMPLS